MFDKQVQFRVGEFDSEKECAAGNEVSAITRHRIFVFGLSVGEGMACCLRFLTSLKLMFSDDIGGRLKALASTKLKVETANRQSSNRVRAYRTHPTLATLAYKDNHFLNFDSMVFCTSSSSFIKSSFNFGIVANPKNVLTKPSI